MSRYYNLGIDPDTKLNVDVYHGYDHKAATPGFYLQAFARKDHPKFKEESENCILNEGMIHGISEQAYNKLKKEWSVSGAQIPVNKKFWTTCS